MIKVLSLKNVRIPVFVLSLFVLSFYVLQVGALNRDIYRIYKYEEELSSLSSKNKFLDIDLSKEISLSNVENHIAGKEFKKADGIKYIKILESSVAAKPR